MNLLNTDKGVVPLKKNTIPKVVWYLGIVSFFNDIASEMLYPVMPIFLTQVLGAPVFVVSNGVESADCKSREFAEQVLAAMTAIVPAAQVAPIAMGAGRGRFR